MLLLINSNKAW